MKTLDGQAISILGLGASGIAAARLALAKGGEVYVSDRSVEPSVAARANELRSLGARVETGGHDLERVAGADTVVVSPGIPPDAEVLQALHARGCRWISEPEFAFRFLQAPLIAVTGTNGKTTTAALTAHILRESGLGVGLGGNIGAAFGPPASGLAMMDQTPDWFVVEVSSFQLADIDAFKPAIGVLTNLAPDHLDRYPSVEAYYRDKSRLFDTATEESLWVLNGDDPESESLMGDAPGSRFRFSVDDAPGAHAVLRDRILRLRLGRGRGGNGDGEVEKGGDALLTEAELPLLGRHNVSNALAASLTAGLAGADIASTTEGLRGFQPLPHRLEPVGDTGGLRWVNDSKATNVAATVGALGSIKGPMVLLIGGKDKGEDLEPLRQAIHDGVRGVVTYGDARERMARMLEGLAPVAVVDGSFEYAVQIAERMAKPGDVLLLSPACSSFDMFQDYEARGRRFTELARGEA